MCVYIYIYGTPPKTHQSSKFGGICSVFHTFLTLTLSAFLWSDNCMFCNSLQTHPSHTTLDSRFKIQHKLVESKGASALNLAS